ncbi:hypothetical protein EUX98_g3371 [Antrodiella citrinella]|uniref:Uncharacterized protein n=1 Tax=Antrodiella citrinella TaxID=2447956 RepID=A0A4S4MZ66_9APHY|nr:hypothetical protein EUX98_g3371 [Antrodiella citrinella]
MYSQVLRSGTCSAATCTGGASVLPGLGVCLSDLVAVPGVASGTTSLAPLPTVSGINTPTSVTDTFKPRTLTWWEILLMALGCAFIFMMVLMCWRRQARKKRAQATAKFAVSKRIHDKTGWRLKLVRFGERLFGHKPMQRVVSPEHHYQDFKMEKMRAAEEARHERDMDGILDAYDYSRPASRRSVSTRAPSAPPTLYDYERDTKNKRLIPQRSGTDPAHNRLSAASLSAVSMYSQVTGLPRRTAEPRQPVRNARDLLPSRFSGTSYSTSTDSGPAALPPVPPVNLMDDSRPPTPAQEYARLVAAQQPATMAPPLHQEFQYVPPRASYWLQPAQTGATNVSRNPFLRP